MLPEIEPALVWGIFIRLVGLVFLISFVSLFGQVAAFAGPHGVNPARDMLSRVRKDFAGFKRYLYFPTLLWIADSDRALRFLVLAGAVAAAAVIYGGAHSPWALLACYVVYVSLDRAVGLVFPWDCVLFETVFLALFLPATEPLPEMAASAAPMPIVAWAYRLLLLRVLLGFGKFKFLGSSREDRGYLKSFFISQPLPTKVGWYAQKLPLPVLKVALLVMFVIEVPVPLLFLLPNDIGVLAAVASILLMAGIQLTGNFGYFNLVVACIAITLFDTHTPSTFTWSGLSQVDAATGTIHAVLGLHMLGGVLLFPMNSFAAQAWPHWPVFARVRPRWLAAPVDLLRLLQPLRWLHPYGVFPPKTVAPAKVVPIVEVSWDGESWHECEHTFSPTRPESPPRFVAPHHPRGDQAVVYEGLGLNDTSLYHNLVGPGYPYRFTHFSSAQALMMRILEGRDYGSVFFKKGALPKDRGPPLLVRMRAFMLTPTTHAERVKTGRWWQRTYIGPHVPEMRLEPSVGASFWKLRLPEPERWHWEDLIWKRRSRLGRLMKAARAGGDPIALAVVDGELRAEDVNEVWRLLERIGPGTADKWERLPELVRELRARYEPEQLRRVERAHARLSVLLAAKLEPLFLDAGLAPVLGVGAKPVLDVKSYLHLGLLVHQLVACGHEVYQQVAGEPSRAARYAESLTLEQGAFHLALFRFEPFVFEAQKLRLMERFLEPAGREVPTARPELAARLDAIARRAWGIVDMVPFVRERFEGPGFDRGHPERYPHFVLEASGEVKLVNEG